MAALARLESVDASRSSCSPPADGAIPEKLRRIAGCIADALGLVSYVVFLGVTFQDPIAFWTVQSLWGRDNRGPIAAVANAISGFQTGDLWTGTSVYWNVPLDLGALVMALVIGIAVLRRLGAGYGLYTLLSVLIPTWSSIGSMIRFAVVLFPVFMVLGDWVGGDGGPRSLVRLPRLAGSHSGDLRELGVPGLGKLSCGRVVESARRPAPRVRLNPPRQTRIGAPGGVVNEPAEPLLGCRSGGRHRAAHLGLYTQLAPRQPPSLAGSAHQASLVEIAASRLGRVGRPMAASRCHDCAGERSASGSGIVAPLRMAPGDAYRISSACGWSRTLKAGHPFRRSAPTSHLGSQIVRLGRDQLGTYCCAATRPEQRSAGPGRTNA